MAFSNVVASARDKISPYMPEITQERAFAVKWAITTIAFTAFSYYAPITFLLSSLTLTYGHIILFNKAIREWDPSRHNTVKVWMITACVVASAFCTVIALRSVKLLPFALELLTPKHAGLIRLNNVRDPWLLPFGIDFLVTRHINLSLACFTLIFTQVGYGGSLARLFYRRGLELMQTATWEPMQAHMKNNDARKKVKSFVDKFGFFLGLIYLNITSLLSTRVQNLIFKFVPEAQKEQKFNELMAHYQSVANVVPQEAQAIWPDILANFKTFSLEKQLQFLPRLIEIKGLPILHEFSEEPLFITYIKRKTAIEQNHGEFYADCELEATTLFIQLDTIKDREPLTEISAKIHALRNKISEYCESIKLYCPDKENILKKFQKFQHNLMSDARIKKLEQLNSQKAAVNEINLNHETDDYLLVKYEQMERGTGELFFNTFCARLNVPSEEVYNKLTELKIGTIGEFIEKVLGGDKTVLEDKGAVLAKLNAFLSKGRLYTILAHGSDLATLAGKVTYKAMILLTAIGPLVLLPPTAAGGVVIGVIGGIFYRAVPFITRRVDVLRSWMERNTPQGVVYQLGIRRPFFTLITDTHPQKMALFASADILKKIRILANELFGYAIPMIAFGGVGLGLVRGIDIGQEAVGLAVEGGRKIGLIK